MWSGGPVVRSGYLRPVQFLDHLTVITTLRVPSSLLDHILIRCQGNDGLPSKLDCLALERCFHFRQNGFDHTIGSDCHSQ